MTQFKPQKGKAYENLPAKTLATFNDTEYLVSTKYDGNQIFITKLGNEVRLFTSDWKEFGLELIEDELRFVSDDFVLIAEFMHGCEGKLGDRVNSAILTTYRTNYNKCVANVPINQSKTNIKVFDALAIKNDKVVTNIKYSDRLKYAKQLTEGLKYISTIEVNTMTGANAMRILGSQINSGWEGFMLVEANSIYHTGKRVNHSIKLKSRKTADLLCIGVEGGEGKYTGMIGALVLQDKAGRICRVGSGLDNSMRALDMWHFKDAIIEIEYEQLMDTYIQPTFIRIRRDKKESD